MSKNKPSKEAVVGGQITDTDKGRPDVVAAESGVPQQQISATADGPQTSDSAPPASAVDQSGATLPEVAAVTAVTAGDDGTADNLFGNPEPEPAQPPSEALPMPGVSEGFDFPSALTALQVKVKRVRKDAKLPAYKTAGAAAFDLHALEGGHVAPGGAMTFRTGVAIQAPEGWCVKLYSRSGQGFNHGVRLANSVGVIDSDFNGEIEVRLVNDSTRDVFEVKAGQSIAQAVVEQAPRFDIVEVDELDETERGAKGFGSTDEKAAA